MVSQTQISLVPSARSPLFFTGRAEHAIAAASATTHIYLTYICASRRERTALSADLSVLGSWMHLHPTTSSTATGNTQSSSLTTHPAHLPMSVAWRLPPPLAEYARSVPHSLLACYCCCAPCCHSMVDKTRAYVRSFASPSGGLPHTKITPSSQVRHDKTIRLSDKQIARVCRHAWHLRLPIHR